MSMIHCMAKDAPEAVQKAFPTAEWVILIEGDPADYRTPLRQVQETMRRSLNIQFVLQREMIGPNLVYVGTTLDPIVASLGIGVGGR